LDFREFGGGETEKEGVKMYGAIGKWGKGEEK
jgi:hypothetical protein